jgi:hypothetical protein
LIKHITLDIKEAKDNLLAAKVAQAEFSNRHCGDEVVYSVGDKVMLSTVHRCHKYMQKNSDRVAKFMPRFNGPFLVIKVFPEKSVYTLELPNELNCFPTFHASLLRKFIPNDDVLFPSRALPRPGPVVTDNSEEEWFINCILDE